MWYRNSQALNIVGPVAPTPGLEQSVPLTTEPIAPPNTPQQPLPIPPLHERCHCKIETMLDGSQIWKTWEKACPICQQARDTFNKK